MAGAQRLDENYGTGQGFVVRLRVCVMPHRPVSLLQWRSSLPPRYLHVGNSYQTRNHSIHVHLR